jgi:hypothetical protein
MLGGGTVSVWSTMELFPWSRGSSCRELAACAIRRMVIACRVLTPTCLPEIALWDDPLCVRSVAARSWAAWTPGRGLGSMGIQGQNTDSKSAQADRKERIRGRRNLSTVPCNRHGCRLRVWHLCVVPMLENRCQKNGRAFVFTRFPRVASVGTRRFR